MTSSARQRLHRYIFSVTGKILSPYPRTCRPEYSSTRRSEALSLPSERTHTTGDGIWKTITDTITVRTVWAVHGIGAGITVRTGVRGHTARGDITATAAHGTTEDGTDHGASADGMIRGIMILGTEADGIAEDGMTLGITEDGTAGMTHGIITTTITDGMTLIISRDISLVEDQRVAETDIMACVHRQTAAT